jgi:hypothetical protein
MDIGSAMMRLRRAIKVQESIMALLTLRAGERGRVWGEGRAYSEAYVANLTLHGQAHAQATSR